jgi:hypothetical protein
MDSSHHAGKIAVVTGAENPNPPGHLAVEALGQQLGQLTGHPHAFGRGSG